MAYTIPHRLRESHGKAGLNLFLGVSKATIERNILEPMREIYTARLVSGINIQNIANVCGEKVYCLGAEKISQVAKVQGMSVKYCYGDEIAKWSPEVFTMMQSRLDKPYSKFDGACNPEYPSHWLKTFIDKPDIDSYIQEYTLFDNPYLSDEFVENICKEYAGTVYYDRYILGRWTLAEGLIYPMYEDALETTPNDKASDYGLSIDYGTRNAFAALIWEKHGDVWYASKGYYYSGRDNGINKTDEDYGHDMDEFVSDIWQRLHGTGRKIRTIVDPSAASFITLLRRRHWCKVIPADNDVIDGIRDTASAMQLGRIKINPSIKEWVEEARGYVWDDEKGIDAPVKEKDHYMDSTRYWVKTMRLVKPINTYKPIYS